MTAICICILGMLFMVVVIRGVNKELWHSKGPRVTSMRTTAEMSSRKVLMPETSVEGRKKLLTMRIVKNIKRRTQRAVDTKTAALLFFILVIVTYPCRAQSTADSGADNKPLDQWQYGAFLDFGYLLDFNHPANRLFRSRGTAFHVDEFDVNMGGAYIRKVASEKSRWGLELTAHGGEDAKVFGFSATAPNLPGADGLRYLGPTDVSYLAPIGKGLTIQGGIFSSFIGYDSLYAKDNFNYTRPWGADFTPYLMLGVNVSYPFTSKATGTLFIVNDYFHLADPNSVPSWGGQLALKPTGHWTVKQTMLIGPHQSDASPEFWRVLSDSIAEWKHDPMTVAFEYQVAGEKLTTIGNQRALWMSAQLPIHWVANKHWSLTLRPEVAWDRDGQWTGFPQTVKALTSTVEYRVPYKQANAIFRLEHRFDDSRGPAGGFFRGSEIAPGVVGLTPGQHLLVFGAIFTFDSTFHR